MNSPFIEISYTEDELILKTQSANPKLLAIDRKTGKYRKTPQTPLLPGQPTQPAFAFLGLLKMGAVKTAIFVADAELVGRVQGAEIYRISEVMLH
jgi:hypothetical protein